MFLTCYAPVRHWGIATPVRLACVRHAASVRPEPGSNSPMRIRYSSSRTTGCSQSSESRQSLQTLIIDLLRGQRFTGFRTPVDSTAHHLSKSVASCGTDHNRRCSSAAAHKVSRRTLQSQVLVLNPLDCPTTGQQREGKRSGHITETQGAETTGTARAETPAA